MSDFKSNEEYAQHVKGLSKNELLQIASAIDRVKYPGRYEIVAEILKENFDLITHTEDDICQGFKYYSGIIFYKRAFLAFSLFTGVIFLWKVLFPESDVFEQDHLLEIVLAFSVNLGIYYGLRNVKSWVVLPILIISTW